MDCIKIVKRPENMAYSEIRNNQSQLFKLGRSKPPSRQRIAQQEGDLVLRTRAGAAATPEHLSSEHHQCFSELRWQNPTDTKYTHTSKAVCLLVYLQ